jgi:hypothetical protein
MIDFFVNWANHSAPKKLAMYDNVHPQSNTTNFTTWISFKRVDTQYTEPHKHFNKFIQADVPTPHVHERAAPGGVRPATPGELPQ